MRPVAEAQTIDYYTSRRISFAIRLYLPPPSSTTSAASTASASSAVAAATAPATASATAPATAYWYYQRVYGA
uniref:Uncharacterized protein n=1 Tax=Syphacia muris TaxID=451379 RepID=A0A0N5AVN6_9BILA